jgi:hypothetical protein
LSLFLPPPATATATAILTATTNATATRRCRHSSVNYEARGASGWKYEA